MKYHGSGRRVWVLVLMLGCIYAGCAGLQQNRVADVEGLLKRAGFTQMPADTPEKLAHLKSLPQHRLIHHTLNGQNRVMYADAAYCVCVYVGDEAQLRHYRNLEIQQNEDPIALMTDPDIVTGTEWSDVWGRSR